MFKIDSAGATAGNEFQDQSASLGVPGTDVSAEWLNAVQRELIAVLTAAGITPNKAVDDQLAQAIDALITAGGGGGGGGGSTFWSDAVATTGALPAGKPTGAIALVLADLGLYRYNGASWTLFFKLADITTALATKIPATEKGAAGGVAPLDGTGKVAASYLPSYVDDVLEYANLAGFPVTGETGKLYLALDTNFIYRWSGSVYVAMSSGSGGPSNTDGLSEGSTNLYHTTERVQDVVGAMADTATIDVIYDDAGNSVTLAVKPGGIEVSSLAATTPLPVAKGGTGLAVAQTTSDIAEGSNLYHTVERVQDVIGGLLVDSGSIDFTYNDAGNAESVVVIPGGIEVDALAATAPLSVAKGGTGAATAIAAANTVGGFIISRKSANFIAAPGYLYMVETAGVPITVTLPAISGGGKFKIIDIGGTLSTNNLTLTPASGEKIRGLITDASKVMATNGASIELYADSVNNYWAYSETGTVGAMLPWLRNTNFTAAPGEKYLIDLTTATVTATLPVTTAAAACSFTDAKGLGSASKYMEIAAGAGQTFFGSIAGDTEIFTYPLANVTYYKAANTTVWYGDYQIAAMSGSGSGGLTPVNASSNVTAAAYTMIKGNVTGGTITVTLPTIPALGGVIGVMDALEICSATAFIRITPASGQQIDSLGLTNSLILDHAKANVVLYAAPGDTSWSVQYPAAILAPAGIVYGSLRLNTANGYGSTNTNIRRMTNIGLTQGSGFTFNQSGVSGDDVTITENGIYSFHYSDVFNAAANMGLSKNVTSGSIASIAVANRLIITSTPGANLLSSVSWTGYLLAGDVIRMHGDTTPSGSAPALACLSVQQLVKG